MISDPEQQENGLLARIKSRAKGAGFMRAGIVITTHGRDFTIERETVVQRQSGRVARFVGSIEGDPPEERIVGRMEVNKTDLFFSYISLVALIGVIIYTYLFHLRNMETTIILIAIIWLFFVCFHLLGKRDEKAILDFLKGLDLLL